MANSKNFLIPISLNGQELQNFIVQNLGVDPTALGNGQLYYNTVTNKLRWHDGTTWREISYIDDAGQSTSTLWSSDKIANEIAAAASSEMSYKGGYDAATNVPNLDAVSPVAIAKGDMYTVTAAGTFFTTQVEIGDVIIAEIASAAAEADWTIVQRNLSTATETSEGTAEIATQAEVDAGTDDVRYVTPLKLATTLDNQNYPQKYEQSGVTIGTTPGAKVITHNLATKAVNVTVYDDTTFEEYVVEVVHTSTNTITIDANGATKTVTVVVIG